MIHWAIRYRPVILELKRYLPSWVLDVGSGPEGVRMFWRGKVVGVDIGFKRHALHNAVIASALALPFEDRSCPFVVSCDMLEHVPTGLRHEAVMQMGRVAGTHLLLMFPSGPFAEEVYESLARKYPRAELPLWLKQHLEYGLPDAGQVEGWLREAGWQVRSSWYEPADLHEALLNWEWLRGGKFLSYSLMRLLGPWIAPSLAIPDGGNKMRVVFKAVR